MAASGSGAANDRPDVGSAPTDPPPAFGPRVGRIVGKKYRVERQIGEGGMGAVYEAEHIHTKRRVALKVLLDERSRPTDAARFMREARAASQIGHPGIVEVLDAGYEGGRPYVALELLEGQTLEDALDEGELTLAQLRDVMLQVLDALHAAHEAGIVHRDIKPENIFLCEGPEGLRAKLLDFGIAKTVEGVDTKLTVTGTVMGTPAYMSPEQAKGDVVDRRADLWSVGAMLFRAVVGHPPFRADNYNILIARILTQDPPPIRERHPTLPEGFAAAIESGLVRKPEARVETALAMAALLRDDAGIEAWGAMPCTAQDLPTAPETRSLSDPPPRYDSAELTLAEAPPEPAPDEPVRATPVEATPAKRPSPLLLGGLLTVIGVAALGAAIAYSGEAAETPPVTSAPAADLPTSRDEGRTPTADPEAPDPETADPETDVPNTDGPVAEEESAGEVSDDEGAEADAPVAEATSTPPARRGARRTAPREPVPEAPSGRRGFVIEREYE
ncbi:MAG: protein kinase [Myxococcales bacterium]|nr:protein kinase [Myxococcales bacterium]